MFYFLKVGPLISGPSLNPLMTAHSTHTWKKNKCHFSVSGRTDEDNVSSLQGLSICSQCHHSVKRLLSFLGEASLLDTGIWHMIKMPKFFKNPDNTHWRSSYAAGYTNVLGSCAGVHVCVCTQNMSEYLYQKSAHNSDVCININIKTTIGSWGFLWDTSHIFWVVLQTAFYFGEGTLNHLTVMGHHSASKAAFWAQGFQLSTYISCPFLAMIGAAQVEQLPLHLTVTYTKTDIL